MLGILPPLIGAGENSAQHQYGSYARTLTANNRDNLPDIPTLKAQPYGIGVILRALAVWEPQARPNTSLLNKPIQVAANSAAVIEEIEDILNDHKVRGPLYYIGKGGSAVVCRTRQMAVRLTTENKNTRTKSRHVLWPEESAPIGNTGLRYEKLRLAETHYVSWHHVDKVHVDLALEGNFFWDRTSDNVGFVDKKPLVIDGGATWTQSRLLEYASERKDREWLDEYKATRRARGLPELVQA